MTPVAARKLDWRVAVGAALAATVLFGIQQSMSAPIARREVSLGHALGLQGLTWGVWLLLLPAIIAAARRYPLEGRPSATWILRTVVIGAAFISTHTILSAVGRWAFGLAVSSELATVISNSFSAGFASNCLRYAAILLALQAIGYHDLVRGRDQQAARLEADLARARLGNVEAYLRPHFLFNTLNSIAALVGDNPRQAERMIGELSDLLRSSLSTDASKEVRLDEELAFTEKYLGLERVRFPDRLQVRVEATEDARRAMVPHLILQPLVENAVRHGIAPLERGGCVSVTAARHESTLRLTVRDDGVGAPPVNGSSRSVSAPGASTGLAPAGIGLRGVRARLAQLYGDHYHFAFRPGDDSGTVVSIEIPYRTSPAGDAAQP